MKQIVFTGLCSVFLCLSALAQGTVEVHIANVRTNQGVCKVCLFDNAAAFNGKGAPYQCISVPVKNNAAQALFAAVPAGTYAISVFHDANSNNKFDLNFLGIPKEGYGASRNRLPFANAPDFEENRFSVAANATVRLYIKLRNL